MKPKLIESESPNGRLAAVLREIGFNREIYFDSGIITSELPELKVLVDEDITLEADDLIIARHLLPRVERATIRAQPEVDKSYVSFASDDVRESMSAEGLGPHTHDVTHLTLDNVQRDFIMKDVDFYYESPLKLGDRVLIIADDETDEYYVIDRIEELDAYQERYAAQKYIDNEGE